MKRSLLIVLCLVGVILVPAGQAYGKTVVCIDGGNDFRYAEGYYRQTLSANDVIQVGGSLADCYCNLEAGDNFIIVAHGTIGGGAFSWGGTEYGGFKRQGSNDAGTGVNGAPYELLAKELQNITVSLWFCEAVTDPVGETTIPTTLTMESIITHGNGTGTVLGPTGRYQIGDYDWRIDRAPAEQVNRAKECFYDAAEAAGHARSMEGISDWIDSMSYNNQQTVPQQVLDECEDIPDITFTITYSPLREESKLKFAEISCDEIDYGDGTLEAFCHVDGPNVCLPPGGDVPTLTEWGLIILALLFLATGTIAIIRRPKAATAGAA